MPKFTKQFWADWQNNDDNCKGDERPASPDPGETSRAQSSSSESQSIASRRLVDPSKTIVDEMLQMPRGHSSKPKTTNPAPQEAESVNQGEQQNAQSPRQASRVRRPESVISRTPPTIAVAPHEFGVQSATDERLVLLREPDSERAASFRVLRHQIVRQHNPQVIVVSSALPEEGKTTTAVNLALALAECGRSRVLLAEMNFTRPCLSALFDFRPPWCFVQQVKDHRTWADRAWSVVEIPPHGLHVAAADLGTERHSLLDAPAFAFAIDQMRMAGYDYIVLDAPSVLGSAEVNLLQDSADGVLLVVRGTKSHRKQLRACVEQLAPDTILGVTLLQD